MAQTTVVTIVVAVLGASALWDFIKFLITRHDSKNESPERIMLRALGERELDQMLHHWLHADVRTADDWRIIDNLYTGYRGLNGNGEIKKLYEEAKQIPTTE